MPGPDLKLVTSAPFSPADALTGRVLMSVLGSLGLSAIVYDSAGRVVRETPAATAQLRADAEEDRLRAVMRRVAQAALKARDGQRCALRTELVTAIGRYGFRGTMVPADVSAAPAAVVAFTLHVTSVLTDVVMRERFGLTGRQVEVARLMSRGLTNAEIGARLAISHHTAERHAERVLRKLRVPTRSSVAAILNGLGQ